MAMGKRSASAGRLVPGWTVRARSQTLLSEVNGHIEGMYNELDVQMKRMARIQMQVDELRVKVKRLAEESND